MFPRAAARVQGVCSARPRICSGGLLEGEAGDDVEPGCCTGAVVAAVVAVIRVTAVTCNGDAAAVHADVTPAMPGRATALCEQRPSPAGAPTPAVRGFSTGGLKARHERQRRERGCCCARSSKYIKPRWPSVLLLVTAAAAAAPVSRGYRRGCHPLRRPGRQPLLLARWEARVVTSGVTAVIHALVPRALRRRYDKVLLLVVVCCCCCRLARTGRSSGGGNPCAGRTLRRATTTHAEGTAR